VLAKRGDVREPADRADREVAPSALQDRSLDRDEDAPRAQRRCPDRDGPAVAIGIEDVLPDLPRHFERAPQRRANSRCVVRIERRPRHRIAQPVMDAQQLCIQALGRLQHQRNIGTRHVRTTPDFGAADKGVAGTRVRNADLPRRVAAA